VGLANAVVAFYIFMLVPEYLLRFIAWVASRLVYRFRVMGDENIPVAGAAVLVCNHVSFVDAVLLMAASPRPIYFVMDHRIFKVPVIPMALTHLWGSFFRRIEKGDAMVRPFRRGLFNRVGLNVGNAVAPAQAQPEVLRNHVAQLLAA
jgi:1-acyl-sn-glycerol-3-phosphate acyltransferase